MNFIQRNGYFVVQCLDVDIQAFNRQHHASIPTSPKITFAFENNSGDMKRVIPNALRSGGLAWESLRDFARNFGQAERRV